jgi:CubicO group peptidase (beta-lactamase class C family)
MRVSVRRHSAPKHVSAPVTGRRVLLAAGLLLAASPAGAQQREPYPGMDAYVTQALATWKVPGVGIAIVRNDSVIYARGYGVRELGKRELVDARTGFAIGSASKAFTAAAVEMLVDSGKMKLDAPATAYLPDFQLFDPYATRELTVRDMLTHRSGLSRGDLSWYASTKSRDEILRGVRFLRPTWSFRSQFGYQNLMYLAAGQAVAHVANTSWDDFVQRRIFDPLGMTATGTSWQTAPGKDDRATPHATVADTVRPIAWRDIDNIGPAGSIVSNVTDMSQWVRLQLANGRYDGKQLISPAMALEGRSPQTVIRLDTAARRFNPATHYQSYGFAWFLQDYRGREVVQHGGNIDGFSALVGMMPEENVGVVILTNMNGTSLPTALMNKIFDWHLKAPARDWSGDLRAFTQAQQARGLAARKKIEAQRVPGTKPSLPLAAYAGTFVDSLYGEITVKEENGKLMLSFGPNRRSELEHWHFDTFRARFDAPLLGNSFVQFRVGPSGKVDELQAEMTDATVFKRRPEPSAATASRSQQ